MADREILERLDQHLAVANGHMARGNELMDEMRQLHVDTRQFMGDLMRRNEIVLDGFLQEAVKGRQILGDLHSESVAQRGAILALIDELREHGLGGRG